MSSFLEILIKSLSGAPVKAIDDDVLPLYSDRCSNYTDDVAEYTNSSVNNTTAPSASTSSSQLSIDRPDPLRSSQQQTNDNSDSDSSLMHSMLSTTAATVESSMMSYSAGQSLSSLERPSAHSINTSTNNCTMQVDPMLEYYRDYDIMVGIRIATSLAILFVAFILFVIYKTNCHERRYAPTIAVAESGTAAKHHEGQDKRPYSPDSTHNISSTRGKPLSSNNLFRIV